MCKLLSRALAENRTLTAAPPFPSLHTHAPHRRNCQPTRRRRAFFAISLRSDGSFAQQYDDHATVRICCGVFASLGLLMWVPDLYGYYFRVSPDEDVREEGRSYAAMITAAVVVLEDV